MHAEVNGHIEYPGPFGKIHAEEKNIAPGAVGQVHPYRGQLAEDRIATFHFGAAEQFRPEAQRLVRRMPHAEHPLVAAHGANAAADLVRQCLKRETMIRRRERA